MRPPLRQLGAAAAFSAFSSMALMQLASSFAGPIRQPATAAPGPISAAMIEPIASRRVGNVLPDRALTPEHSATAVLTYLSGALGSFLISFRRLSTALLRPLMLSVPQTKSVGPDRHRPDASR